MTQIPGQESGKVMQKSTVRGTGQEDGNSTASLKYFPQATFIPELQASHLRLGAAAVLPTNEPAIPGGRRDLGRDHCSLQHVPERKVQHPASPEDTQPTHPKQQKANAMNTVSELTGSSYTTSWLLCQPLQFSLLACWCIRPVGYTQHVWKQACPYLAVRVLSAAQCHDLPACDCCHQMEIAFKILNLLRVPGVRDIPRAMDTLETQTGVGLDGCHKVRKTLQLPILMNSPTHVISILSS